MTNKEKTNLLQKVMKGDLFTDDEKLELVKLIATAESEPSTIVIKDNSSYIPYVYQPNITWQTGTKSDWSYTPTTYCSGMRTTDTPRSAEVV